MRQKKFRPEAKTKKKLLAIAVSKCECAGAVAVCVCVLSLCVCFPCLCVCVLKKIFNIICIAQSKTLSCREEKKSKILDKHCDYSIGNRNLRRKLPAGRVCCLLGEALTIAILGAWQADKIEEERQKTKYIFQLNTRSAALAASLSLTGLLPLPSLPPATLC